MKKEDKLEDKVSPEMFSVALAKVQKKMTVKELNVNKKTAYKYYPKTDKKALIKDYIKSHPNDSITSIARALNISRPTVYKYR